MQTLSARRPGKCRSADYTLVQRRLCGGPVIRAHTRTAPLPMNPSPPESGHWQSAMSPRLSCLVVGESDEYIVDARQRLLRSSRVGAVETVADDIALAHELAASQHDLVVLILEAPDSPLPRCLLKHGDTRVLVVAPNGVRGTLARWLQQGADDLVSPDDTDAYDHALSRLLDACALSATTRRQAVMIDVQRQRIESLVSRSPLVPVKRATLSAGRHGKRSLNLLGKTRKVSNAHAPNTAVTTDCAGHTAPPVNELPDRRQTLNRLLALSARPACAADELLFAVQFNWTLGDDTSGTSSGSGKSASPLDRIIADLAIYRAADALRRMAPRRLLLGRTRLNRLVLLMPADTDIQDKVCSEHIRRARAQLGTLDGLLGSAMELELTSMKGSFRELARPELLAELDARYRARSRSSGPYSRPSDNTVVPMVTNRAPSRSGSGIPQLAAARS